MTSPVVLNHRGTPEPSSEIQRRLAAVHPRLMLRYVEVAGQNWAICMTWDDNDPRWGMVQSQDLDPNRSMDIIGYLPMDCGPEEAPAYLGRALRQYPKDEVQNLADRVMAFNETVPLAQAVDAAIAEVLDNPDPSGTAKRRGRSPKGKS